MLYGAGSLFTVTTELENNGSTRGQELVFPNCLASFELNADSSFLEAKCLEGGRIQTVASAISEEVYTFNTTSQFIDFNTISYSFDEQKQSYTNISCPELVTATVDAAGEITDPNITAANADSILVYRNSRGSWGGREFLTTAVTPGSPTANEFEVDTVNNKIITNVANAGAIFTYQRYRTYATIDAIGLGGGEQYGRLEFWGVCYTTEGLMKLHIPQMGRISTPSITVNGSVTELNVEFRPEILPGRDRPFELYDISSST